jgi:predicted ATP-grasp superfamily ATP-dependent carboligase
MDARTRRTVEKVLAQARGRRPLAVVLGGSVNGLSFVRNLGRRGIPTLLLDGERAVAMSSRFGSAIQLPPPDGSPEPWLELLEYLGSRLGAPGVLFPTSDALVLLVSRHAEAFARHFRFLVPGAETTARILDKRIQYTAARAAGIPVPRTWFPRTLDDVRSLSTDELYPCILKPHTSHEGRKRIGNRKAVVIETKESLVSVFESLGGGDPEFMVQEIIPGADDALYGYLAFWSADRRELAWLTKRKLRQHPPRYGDGSWQETIDCPEVARLGRRLMRAFDYQGFVGIEFKVDARDGTCRLMEINPRTVSGNQLCIEAGVDFPGIGYQYLTGCDLGIDPARPFRRGVRYVHETWDLRACLALRTPGQLGLGPWVRSLREADARALWASDDPRPLVAAVYWPLRAALREAATALGRKWKRLRPRGETDR